MPPNDTIRILQAGGARAATLDADEWRRIAVRVAWVRETMAKLKAAQRRVDQAWELMLAEQAPPPIAGEGGTHAPAWEEEGASNGNQDLPPPPEQSELDRIHAELRAVIDHDRWPRELHFNGI